MSFGAGSMEPDESVSPPLVPANPDLGNKSPYTTGQLVNPLDWDVPNNSTDSHDSTSSSSSSDGPDTDMNINRDNCERVLEQWRLFRLAEKNKPKKKKVVCLELESQKEADMMQQNYPYHGVYTAPFGRNYSKFYEAFRQGLHSPPTNQNTAATVPAKRSAPSSDHAAKRPRREEVASHQPAGQDQARTNPAKRAATTNIEPAPKRSKVVTLRHSARDEIQRITSQAAAPPSSKASSGKPKGVTSSVQVASESPVTPRPRSEAKGKPPSVMIPTTFKAPRDFEFSKTNLLIVPRNRSAFQAERRRSLCGKLGIRDRRGEGTGVFECCAKHCGLGRANYSSCVRQIDVKRSCRRFQQFCRPFPRERGPKVRPSPQCGGLFQTLWLREQHS